jgi:hypothetical protein
METKCFFSTCKASVAYSVVEHRGQHVADRTVHACEAHRPGAKSFSADGQFRRDNPPAPSGVAYASPWYNVTPCAS